MYLTRSVERTTNLNNLYRRRPALTRVLSNSPPPAIILACKSGASSARKLYRPYLSCYAAWNNIKHEGANNKSLRPCVEIWTGVRLSRSLHNIFFRPTRQAHTTRTRQWNSRPDEKPEILHIIFLHNTNSRSDRRKHGHTSLQSRDGAPTRRCLISTVDRCPPVIKNEHATAEPR